MEITVEMVKSLRDVTGAGMMECKKALQEANGDIEKAKQILRAHGAAVAEKRAGREAKQGVVESYIHTGGRIGAMVEVNCETDFVARTDEFKQLARDIAMQIAAMTPLVITREEAPAALVERELNVYREQARGEGKPEEVVEKVAQDRLEKYYQEVVLLEQAFIKEPQRMIKELITDMTAKTGENVSIRRFQRFELGVDGTK
ncbi:MAG: translation elongation factor Ts [Bacteroidetes bacterium]|nr:translation elongation factor Ts [Bacteroidota bacterium]MCL5738352.1 translation elongation factor Ts [Bacteroidota bacterium]